MLAAAAAALRHRAAAAATASPICASLAAAARCLPAASTSLNHSWSHGSAWGDRRPFAAAPPPPPPPASAPPPPWTPTGALAKRKFMPRRMAHLLQLLEAEAVAEAGNARVAAAGGAGGGSTPPPTPSFRAGDVLEVRAVLPDARRRVAVLRGVCIGRRNRGLRSSFDLLTYVPGGGAVHRTFPLHAPTLHGVRVVERRRARRAKLYYLKDRNPKEFRV